MGLKAFLETEVRMISPASQEPGDVLTGFELGAHYSIYCTFALTI